MVLRQSPSPGVRRPRVARKRGPRLQAAHLFVLPYVVFLALFAIGPAVYAFLLSFADFQVGTPRYFDAGLDNYGDAFSDSRFLPAFARIAQFLAISVPLGAIGVVAIAVLLHARRDRLSSGMRTLYFVPGAVAGPTVVLLAIFMFDPNVSPFGPLFRAFGMTSVGEIARGDRLPFVFSIMFFFAAAGGWIAIFYGALNGISREILEAGAVDGCDGRRLAWSIKLPLIRPYVVYMLILTFAANFQLFAEPQLLARAPGASITKYWAPSQLSYAFAFELGDFGRAAAVSLLMLVIGLVCAILIIRLTGFFQTEVAER